MVTMEAACAVSRSVSLLVHERSAQSHPTVEPTDFTTKSPDLHLTAISIISMYGYEDGGGVRYTLPHI